MKIQIAKYNLFKSIFCTFTFIFFICYVSINPISCDTNNSQSIDIKDNDMSLFTSSCISVMRAYDTNNIDANDSDEISLFSSPVVKYNGEHYWMKLYSPSNDTN
jgi:hypothetical protein